MRRRTQAIVVAVSMMAAGLVQAAWTFEYTEGKQCEIGGDLRLRMTHFDRDVITPDWDLNGSPTGPALEYLRMRERVWGCFDLTETSQLMIRLTNRWHHYSSTPSDPNNIAHASDGAGWNFPDEVIVDNLYLDLWNVMDSNWSLRIGRQDIFLGNGMVLLEGTPYDQGRSIYFDGIVATYQTECDTVKLLSLYNRYKDGAVFINDQNRRLRRGDTWVSGAYWTHRYNENLNTDLYYLFADIDDDRDQNLEPVERFHRPDENAQLHIAGVRVFGSPSEQVDYSIEFAQQAGEYSDQADFTGSMADARLTLKAATGNALSPELTLQYTYMSGDDLSSADEYEGWHPAFAEYPIWREELLPIMFNGHWTNLNQYRTALALQLMEKVRLTTAWAALIADYGEYYSGAGQPSSGGGDNIGHLVSAFLDIGVTENMSVAVEAAQFHPGNHFADGHTSEWLRLQTVYTF